MSDTRRKFIAGNWKMNCSRSEAIQLASAVVASSEEKESAQILICVPNIHLADIGKLAVNSHVLLGAQDAYWQDSGAFTGEISISMLADYQVKYLLVGHSERREMFANTDEIVAKKFAGALKHGIKPILCIGESLAQREQGVTFDVLKEQCQAVIDEVGIEAFADACIAYEPIWAIGTGRTATPEQAQEVHHSLRVWLAEKNAQIAKNLQILYGGSMNAANASELLAQPDIDGGLIGGASLKAEDFLKIYSVAG
ncbi:triose-phosphate isomerase [Aliikangiella coralliicola]|uniref:Triosephosphate isomerase n=1 Tax=Aliikangiella coralliicola TaxID=2592383 RepID=A0A545UHV5_9GAMM|nr:triose-phosphate isomerase [Aliikangiella coralliicola]TQV88993.1 triose-phosphate isomerase [Aliikangiella coralliicola]